MKGFWSIFIKITIPTAIIYAIVLLVAFQSYSSSNEKSGYNRNCAILDETPSVNETTPSPPSSAPKWNNVHSAKEFWTAVHDQPKNVVLFGTEYCTWCRAAEKWWKENGEVDGWQFVDWNYMDKDGEKSYNEFLKTVTDIYHARNPKDSEVGFPACAAMVNPQPGKPLTESVIYAAVGYDECSKLLKNFVLSVNPHT